MPKDFNLQFTSSVNLSGLQNDLQKMQQSLSNLNLTKTLQSSFEDLFRRINKEMTNFTNSTERNFESMGDIRKLEQSYNKIDTLFSLIQKRIGEINSEKVSLALSSEDQQKLNNLNSTLEETRTKLMNLNSAYTQLKNTVKNINFKGTGIQEAVSEIAQLASEGRDYSKQLDELRRKLNDTDSSYEANGRTIKIYQNQLDELKAKLATSTSTTDELEAQVQSLKDNLKTNFNDQGFTELELAVKKASDALSRYRNKFNKLPRSKQGGNISDQKQYKKLQEQLTQATAELQKFKQANQEISDLQARINSLQELQKQISQVETAISSLTQEQRQLDAQNLEKFIAQLNEIETSTEGPEKLQQSINEVESEIEQIRVQNIEEASRELNNTKLSADSAAVSIRQVGYDVEQTGSKAESLKNISREFEELYTRAANFFTITNGFELLERAVRSAYESVKELDAAMTDIAVVTDFDLGDVWGTVPEYTDLANELGTTILGAYDTAKLYYQQGMVKI